MAELMSYLDTVFFTALPYAAVLIFLVGSIRRYYTESFSYSSLSSQFLENKRHFWAVVPFHYGIVLILLAHIIGFFFPGLTLWWNSSIPRLYALEIAGIICGIATLVGLFFIVERRLSESRIKVVTSTMDWVVYILLGIQVLTGVYNAVFHPWGTSWFATSAAPYLWSLVLFDPKPGHILEIPFFPKLHIINAFLILGFFPYTRLVHIVVMPVRYLWRKLQIVRWYRLWSTARIRG